MKAISICGSQQSVGGLNALDRLVPALRRRSRLSGSRRPAPRRSKGPASASWRKPTASWLLAQAPDLTNDRSFSRAWRASASCPSRWLAIAVTARSSGVGGRPGPARARSRSVSSARRAGRRDRAPGPARGGIRPAAPGRRRRRDTRPRAVGGRAGYPRALPIGPADRQPGGLVDPRGVLGAAFGDLHRRGAEPRAEVPVGPQLGQDSSLSRCWA